MPLPSACRALVIFHFSTRLCPLSASVAPKPVFPIKFRESWVFLLSLHTPATVSAVPSSCLLNTITSTRIVSSIQVTMELYHAESMEESQQQQNERIMQGDGSDLQVARLVVALIELHFRQRAQIQGNGGAAKRGILSPSLLENQQERPIQQQRTLIPGHVRVLTALENLSRYRQEARTVVAQLRPIANQNQVGADYDSLLESVYLNCKEFYSTNSKLPVLYILLKNEEYMKGFVKFVTAVEAQRKLRSRNGRRVIISANALRAGRAELVRLNDVFQLVLQRIVARAPQQVQNQLRPLLLFWQQPHVATSPAGAGL